MSFQERHSEPKLLWMKVRDWPKSSGFILQQPGDVEISDKCLTSWWPEGKSGDCSWFFLWAPWMCVSQTSQVLLNYWDNISLKDKHGKESRQQDPSSRDHHQHVTSVHPTGTESSKWRWSGCLWSRPQHIHYIRFMSMKVVRVTMTRFFVCCEGFGFPPPSGGSAALTGLILLPRTTDKWVHTHTHTQW